MIRRLVALYRANRADGRSGLIGYLLMRFRREPKEPPSARCPVGGEECWCTLLCEPDAGLAAPTVQLPTVPDPAAGDGPAVVVHVGATEDFGDLLKEMRDDLAHGGDGIDPETLAWDAEFAALDRRLADAHMAFVRGWRRVDALAERVAPGWRSEPAHPAADFAEVREQIGVMALEAA